MPASIGIAAPAGAEWLIKQTPIEGLLNEFKRDNSDLVMAMATVNDDEQLSDHVREIILIHLFHVVDIQLRFFN
jgi:hypothetical protein